MNRRAIVLFVLCLTLAPRPAAAEPVTYDCRLVNVQAPEPDRFRGVNQIVIDDAADTLELKASGGFYWIFATREQDMFIVRTLQDGSISGAGTRAGTPSLFELSPDRMFRFANIFADEIRWFEWQCEG